MKTNPQKIHNNPSDISSRVLLFTLLRVIFSGGNPSSWTIGAPATLLAFIASIAPIPPGLPRVFMANPVNLLPGTLSVALTTELNQNALTVHVLDRNKQITIELESVEHRVARLFGVSLPAASQRQE